MVFIYNIAIRLYFIGIRLLAFRNKKAAAWIAGRKFLFENLERKITPGADLIWMHCSSAGEFEQGKPLIEAVKKTYPAYKVLVSFFSPSGFSVAGNYIHADYITYLPLDTRTNAERFVKLVNPKLVLFVKYEFWYHHLQAVSAINAPLLLISAVFRKDQVFFKPYGKFFRSMLTMFNEIFVQDTPSLQLLLENGMTNTTLSGDTRFDRVKELADTFLAIAPIEDFIGDANVLVAGSTWEGDEQLLAAYLKTNSALKLLLAPHQISESHLAAVRILFPDAMLYSQLPSATDKKAFQVLLIDTVGLLSRLYNYGTINYVGGGFTKDGIHNILEAAVWTKPVIFGPNYKKYREATELISTGGGFSIQNIDEMKGLTDNLLINRNQRQTVGEYAKNYIEKNTGATEKIMHFIQEKRLLTN